LTNGSYTRIFFWKIEIISEESFLPKSLCNAIVYFAREQQSLIAKSLRQYPYIHNQPLDLPKALITEVPPELLSLGGKGTLPRSRNIFEHSKSGSVTKSVRRMGNAFKTFVRLTVH